MLLQPQQLQLPKRCYHNHMLLLLLLLRLKQPAVAYMCT
jgi:hypothetical protein